MLTPAQRAKFALLARGVGVTSACEASIAERQDGRPLTLADYASTSGVTLALEDDVWVNAPIVAYNPNMVFDPLYELDADGDRFVLRERATRRTMPAEFVPVPAYQVAKNGNGIPYTEYVNTHGDRARISPVRGCAMRCKFCDIPYEFQGRYEPLSIVRLLEAAARAFDDPVQPASHLLISGGTPGRRDYDYLRKVYRSVISGFEGIDIDVMMVPDPDLLDLEELATSGVNELSLNLEIWDEEIARRIIPEKARTRRADQLDFIATAVDRLGPGRVRSILMVGLEDVESTLEGVRELVGVGCVPVLSPFRPDPITELKDRPAPDMDTMIAIWERASEIVSRAGSMLGPHCIPCSHNTLTLADGSERYRYHHKRPTTI